MGHGNLMERSEMKSEGVKMLLGDPQKAIIKLTLPIVLSLVANGLLHITDMVWVSGLGPGALSALGFFVPIYILASALATGIGIGGGTCISQCIGAKDKKGADEFTTHMLFIIIFVSVVLVTSLFFIIKPLFTYMGANKSINMAISYSRIMILGFIFMLFSEGAYALFRSEGNAKIIMVISLISVAINMILDPIFIYTLDMGVEGAAWASFVALCIASLTCFYWLFLRKTTYVSIVFKSFRLQKQRVENILHLGIPIAVSQILMGIMLFANIKVIANIGGVNGVAVYSTGLRYMHFLMLPLISISAAAVTVIGAAFGAQDKGKMKIAFIYSLKIGVISALVMYIFTFIAAPIITIMFTWAKGSTVLTDDLIDFLKIVFLGHPPVAIAMITGSLFIGIGKSIRSLLLEILRNIVLTIPLVIVFGIILNYGLVGVWIGIVIANWSSAIIAITWSRHFFNCEETVFVEKVVDLVP